MLNFIRFDILKLFKMKGLYYSLIILSLIIGVGMVADGIEYHTSYEDYAASIEGYNDSDNEEEKLNTGTGVTYNILNEAEFEEYKIRIQETASMANTFQAIYPLGAMVAFVFFALFVGNDFSSGYFKNMMALRGAKWKWLTSKIFVAIVYFVLIIILSFVFGIIYELITQQFMSNVPWGSILVLSLLYALQYIIVMLFVTALVLLLQSRVTTIVIATLMGMGIHQQLLNQLGNVVKIDFLSMIYSIRLSNIGLDFSNDLTNLLLSGAISGLGLYLFNRWRIYHMDFKFEN